VGFADHKAQRKPETVAQRVGIGGQAERFGASWRVRWVLESLADGV